MKEKKSQKAFDRDEKLFQSDKDQLYNNIQKQVMSQFVTNTFTRMYSEALRADDPLLGAIASSFMMSPCDEERYWTDLMEADILIPVNIILWRIMISHNMDTAIMMRGGAETGQNIYGHTNFVLGSDVATKMIYGNFTFYSKAMVFDDRNITLIEDIHPSGYVGGMNTEYMQSYKDLEFSRVEKLNGRAMRSVIATVIPINEDSHPPIMSLTGKINLGNLQYKEQQDNYHYSSAEHSCERWQISRLIEKPAIVPEDNFYTRADHFNTVAVQGRQASYHIGSRYFEDWSTPSGHRGKNGSHPGCRETWNGKAKMFPVFNANDYHLQ